MTTKFVWVSMLVYHPGLLEQFLRCNWSNCRTQGLHAALTGVRWGGSGIYLGCLLDASLVWCSGHVPLVGGPWGDPGDAGETVLQKKFTISLWIWASRPDSGSKHVNRCREIPAVQGTPASQTMTDQWIHKKNTTKLPKTLLKQAKHYTNTKPFKACSKYRSMKKNF